MVDEKYMRGIVLWFILWILHTEVYSYAMHGSPDGGNSTNSSAFVVEISQFGENETVSALECYRPHPANTTIAIVIMDAVLCLLTIVGNFLVIFSILRFRLLRTVTNVFVASLACADLLVGLNVPYYIVFYFDIDSLSCQRTSCLLRYWFTIYTSGCSMFCLVGVAVDRYIAILHPLSYYRVMRITRAFLYVMSVWLFMGIISSLPFFGIGDQFDYTQECDLYYTHTMEYVLSAVASSVLFTFIVTTVLYIRIFQEAWKQNKAVQELNPNVQQETRTARTMALVFGVSFMGFLPYFIIISFRYLPGINQEKVNLAKPFVVSCYFSKSAINPIIYGWKNKDFRAAFRKLILQDTRSVEY